MNLQTRVINILSRPEHEWPIIASEATDVVALYKDYIMPLAAIPPICRFLGMAMMGVTIPLAGLVRTPTVSGLTGMVVGYGLSLVGIFLSAFIVNKLAPSFQSSGGIVQAMKMVAFSSTAPWLAGVLQLVPVLGGLALLAALYGVYLFYLGLPSVMKTPPDKVIPYLIVSTNAIIVISVVTASVFSIFVTFSRFVS